MRIHEKVMPFPERPVLGSLRSTAIAAKEQYEPAHLKTEEKFIYVSKNEMLKKSPLSEEVYHLHWHNNIEFVFIESGSMKFYSGGSIYNLTEGDFLAIRSHELHSGNICNVNNCERILVQFSPDIILPAFPGSFEVKYLTPFINVTLPAPLLHLPEKESVNTGIDALIREIYHVYMQKNYAYDLKVKILIYQIILKIVERSKGHWSVTLHDQDDGAKYNEITRIIKYIQENFRDNISIRDMAFAYNMSYSTLCRIMKRKMGLTINEYINGIRLMEAERLLLTTDKSILAISGESGFSDPSYFTRVFKKRYGYSPTRFRTDASAVTYNSDKLDDT